MTYVHLYPFAPWGWYGGTLRLRTALEGTALRGRTRALWFDAMSGEWRELSVEGVGAPDNMAARGSREVKSCVARLKRYIFPSTLWESGRRPRRTLASAIAARPSSTVILHTTYLAPAAAVLSARGHRTIIDAHDVVHRAHRDDAAATAQLRKAVRSVYATTVRARELSSLRRVAGVVVAGWTDAELLRSAGVAEVYWAPTGLDATYPARPPSRRLRIGLLGNFAHSATVAAAIELIESPLGRGGEVDLVFAGMNSHLLPDTARVQRLGPISDPAEFYSAIDASVVPASNGSGMKCKLAEAALAGRPVITTPLGAAGYPSELRDAMTVVDGPDQLGYDVVRQAVCRAAPEALRRLFEDWVGREAAASRYATAIGELR